MLKYEIKLLESYYPESLGTTLIVNAPWVFYGCWQIIKPWIDPVARAKILFVDVADIKKWVEPENLLKEYGGEDPYKFSYIPPDERNDENKVYSLARSLLLSLTQCIDPHGSMSLLGRWTGA